MTRTKRSGRGRRSHQHRDGKLLLELLWSGYNSCGRKLSCCVYIYMCVYLHVLMIVSLHKSIYRRHVFLDLSCCSGTLKLPCILSAAGWNTQSNELRGGIMIDRLCFLLWARLLDELRNLEVQKSLWFNERNSPSQAQTRWISMWRTVIQHVYMRAWPCARACARMRRRDLPGSKHVSVGWTRAVALSPCGVAVKMTICYWERLRGCSITRQHCK